MSERQAKLKRKNEIKETPKKKKSAMDIIFNIIIVVLILAVLGIGSWAVYSKYSQMPAGDTTENAQTPTVAEYAQTEGIAVDEFLAQYGLGEVSEITADSQITDIIPHMTLANYAAFSGTDVAEMKESMGLGEEYADDTLMSVIIDEITATLQTENSDENAEEPVEQAE